MVDASRPLLEADRELASQDWQAMCGFRAPISSSEAEWLTEWLAGNVVFCQGPGELLLFFLSFSKEKL